MNSEGKKPQLHCAILKHCAVLPHFAQGFFNTLVNAQPQLCWYFIVIFELHYLQPTADAKESEAGRQRGQNRA